MTPYVGIDFGTTNSAIAVASGDGRPALLAFAAPPGAATGAGDAGPGEPTPTWRSVLYFDPTVSEAEPAVFAGSHAIARYVETEGEGRLIQSIKSYLASALFSRTRILGRPWRLEELIGAYLRQARRAVGDDLGACAVVGRPVRYWGAESAEDDARAVDRMRGALALAGFDEVVFEYEPVAAASAYAVRLDADELVMIADFGGGTSDFSLVRVGPGVDPGDPGAILATGGVGIGGDAFDARIIDAVVAPMLGKGTSYRDEFGAETRIPVWIFHKLRRWHHLSFLKTRKTTALLERFETGAVEPGKIRNLRAVIDGDLGLPLHQSVEASKLGLSAGDEARFRFVRPPVALSSALARDEFTGWIAPDLDGIDAVITDVLARAGVDARQVDRVFATGGSSLVPAVRARLAARFGDDKVVGGDELTSVALGLAERARRVFGSRTAQISASSGS